MAIGSLAASIVGIPISLFCMVGLMLPLVGIVLGVIALTQINQTNQRGRGLAIGGIVVGGAAIVLVLIVILLVAGFGHAR